MAAISVRNHPQLGRGVFAEEFIPKNAKIVTWAGEIVDRVPEPYTVDFHTQIGPKKWMGPSGKADDFVNHSCDPNAGLTEPLELIAVKNIQPGEEITWDYSTWIIDDPWSIPCKCGSKRCRKVVADWLSIPKEVQKEYLVLGIVPSYAAMRG